MSQDTSSETEPKAQKIGTAVPDVDVVVWSPRVLPSDGPGTSRGGDFNDPHKYEFCRYLAALDCVGEVTLICRGLSATAIESQEDGFTVHRVGLQPGASLIRTVVAYNLCLAVRALRSKMRVVYFYDDGEAAPFILPLLLARARGFPVVLDYRNPPVDHSLPDAVRHRRVPAFVAEWLAAGAASLIVTLSETCSAIVERSFKRTSIVAPSVVTPGFFRDPQVRQGDSGLIRFVYWGSIDAARNLGELVAGFIRACRKDPATPRELVLVGDGNDRARLEGIARAHGDMKIRFEGWRPHHSLLEVLDTATVSVVAIPTQGERYAASSPLKFAEALALGRPILGSKVPAMEVVSERNLGILVEHSAEGYEGGILAFNADEISRFIKNLAEYGSREDSRMPETVFKGIVDWLGQGSPFKPHQSAPRRLRKVGGIGRVTTTHEGQHGQRKSG